MAVNQTPYLFTQVTQFIDRKYFEYLVKLYDGNRYVKFFLLEPAYGIDLGAVNYKTQSTRYRRPSP